VKRGGPRSGLFRALLVLVGAAASVTCVASAAAGVAKAPQQMTIYSIATQEQFLNHKDDRARGNGNNPFGNFKDTTTPTAQGGNGPFAGDRAVFTFKLFKSADLRTAIGSATLVCQYSFNKNAFCNAAYVLKGGTLIGGGEFNFNASKFALGIQGGTGEYSGKLGDLALSPAANHAQRLVFTFADKAS
jgi:hypothetical protein